MLNHIFQKAIVKQQIMNHVFFPLYMMVSNILIAHQRNIILHGAPLLLMQTTTMLNIDGEFVTGDVWKVIFSS